jgi:hypothetical protein
MKKLGVACFLLFAAVCLGGPKDSKMSKFMPPAESHGMPIIGYGCDKEQVTGLPTSSHSDSYWRLILWAQYGKDHKRYWQKTYGTYEIPERDTMGSSGESAGSGATIGGFNTEEFDFRTMDKVCAEWGTQVKSTLKVDAKEGENAK